MTDILAGALGVVALVLMSLVGFVLKREREFGTIQATLKACHKRLDRLEKKENGGIE